MAGAGHRPRHQEQAPSRITLEHLQVADGDALRSHVAGHLHPFEHAAWAARADGAGRAVAVRLAVGLGSAGKAVALDPASEASADAGAGNVHPIAFLEDLHSDAIAHLVLADIVCLELAQVAQVAQTLQVATLGFVDVLGDAEAELHGGVAVGILGLDLSDQARPSLDDGGAAKPALLVEGLEHAELAAEQSLDHSLTSMSTPEGSWSRISVSTVFEVGLRMSISRLCVRISNCSRPSLWTKGERMTVSFLICVGSGIGPATTAPVRSAASTICSAD